ncbi:uncharacterized protein isoform X2 [Danio rerio]|uniref:Uncharacterized protein isoform X2 n=1 Tax=Danio rerio TaxID=7955 RepID=A0AB32TBA8_DANRE
MRQVRKTPTPTTINTTPEAAEISTIRDIESRGPEEELKSIIWCVVSALAPLSCGCQPINQVDPTHWWFDCEVPWVYMVFLVQMKCQCQ